MTSSDGRTGEPGNREATKFSRSGAPQPLGRLAQPECRVWLPNSFQAGKPLGDDLDGSDVSSLYEPIDSFFGPRREQQLQHRVV
jgi:hypothetical protein